MTELVGIFDKPMIKLSKLADYGVALLTHLANAPRDVHSAQQVADATGIPLPTVSKLLSAFARAELLATTRGAKGGFRLARRPADISVAEIVAAIDGPIALTQCLEDSTGSCTVEPICPSRPAWHTINQAVRQAFQSVSLADLLGWPPARAPRPFPATQPHAADKRVTP